MAETEHLLEGKLEEIRFNTRKSFDDATGKTDFKLLTKQKTSLRKWMLDFSLAYVAASKRLAKKHDRIVNEAEKLLKHAWFTYEVMIEADMFARGPAGIATKWNDLLGGGPVPAALKAQLLEEVDKLLEKYRLYRQIF